MGAERDKVVIFSKDDMADLFVKMEGINGQLARVVNEKYSSTVGGGFAELDNDSFEWKLYYDEIVYVLEGELIIVQKDKEHRCKAGDMMFLHKGLEFAYKAEGYCRFLFAVYPVNWREIEGIS